MRLPLEPEKIEDRGGETQMLNNPKGKLTVKAVKCFLVIKGHGQWVFLSIKFQIKGA